MNHQINRLIHFGLQHHLISEDDEIYAVNLLLDLFHLDHARASARLKKSTCRTANSGIRPSATRSP